MSFASMYIRNKFRRGDEKRDAGLTTPEDVVRFDDLCYGSDEKWNVLDVYRPKGAEGKLPVIVSVHGGAWVYGDKEVYQYYCMSLARHGFAVVNFTYRLAPAHKHPASLEDTTTVFAWVLAHAEEYGFDTKNIFAVGDSAGAQLLGLYACLCTNPDFAAALPFKADPAACPKALGLNCGIYLMDEEHKTSLNTVLMGDYLPQKGTPEELRSISVYEQVTSAFPPSFVMTAEGDFLAEQALPFAEKLRSLGVDAQYHYYGDKDHVLGHVFHCNMRLPEGQQCNKDECDYFKSFLQ